MSIADDISDTLKSGNTTKDQWFTRQIEENAAFRRRMEDAGVFPQKREFSIPLIERIGTLNFSD